MSSAQRRDEKGAVAVIFAALLATGVFLGCAALAVDFGHLNANHSQLQSSAAAAARQAAITCATTDTCPSEDSLNPISQANDNTPDHPSTVTKLCGNGGGLPSCGSTWNDTSNVTKCPNFSWDGDYVQALTQKGTDFTFANNGAGGEATGRACAAVAWGTPNEATVIPFTISLCEFNNAVGALTAEGGAFPSPNVAIALNYKKKNGACSGFQGHDFPGGFGWLDHVTNCQADVKVGDWVGVNPGMGNAGECDTQIDAAIGSIVFVPIFDCISATDTFCDMDGGGNTVDYHLYGLAAFQLDGFNAPSYHGDTGSNDGLKCPGKAHACMYGHFVKAIVPVGSIDTSGTAPDLGARTIRPIG